MEHREEKTGAGGRIQDCFISITCQSGLKKKYTGTVFYLHPLNDDEQPCL